MKGGHGVCRVGEVGGTWGHPGQCLEGQSHRLAFPAGVCEPLTGTLSNAFYLMGEQGALEVCFCIYEVFVFTADVLFADVFYFADFLRHLPWPHVMVAELDFGPYVRQRLPSKPKL